MIKINNIYNVNEWINIVSLADNDKLNSPAISRLKSCAITYVAIAINALISTCLTNGPLFAAIVSSF